MDQENNSYYNLMVFLLVMFVLVLIVLFAETSTPDDIEGGEGYSADEQLHDEEYLWVSRTKGEEGSWADGHGLRADLCDEDGDNVYEDDRFSEKTVESVRGRTRARKVYNWR